MVGFIKLESLWYLEFGIFLSVFVLCNVWFIVTMQAQKEAPPDMQCRDKFLIQSVIAPNGATNKDVTQELVGYLCYRVIVYKMF